MRNFSCNPINGERRARRTAAILPGPYHLGGFRARAVLPRVLIATSVTQRRLGMVYGGYGSSRALVARPIAQMRHLDSHRRTRTQERCILWTVILYIQGASVLPVRCKIREMEIEIRQTCNRFSLDKNCEYALTLINDHSQEQ